jgi:DNA ligase D-like protein (predicted ligase)/DNA ligase D-like protein (predicted polymerase)/DNA ligase D-like protein (predicted 3'-phosphoesterase)
MARTSQLVEVGKRKLELSNLEKVLYPEDQVLKAEIIQYYLSIAPTILNHIKGRPLSLVRYPDGIHGEQFFQKNRPEWTPQWVEYTELGKEKLKQYVVATEEATLVWLANLACLELHHVHSRKPHLDKPDNMVFDLDPPEGYGFEDVVDIAFRLKEHLEGYDYIPFAKTSGKKGVHVVVPLESNWDFEEVFQATKNVAIPFVQENTDTTLQIKKDSRKGRVLIDIYRNRPSQTIVSAYSLRGAIGAPISMPLTWEELGQIKSAGDYNIHNTVKKVLQDGDAWEAIMAYARPLHTKIKKNTKRSAPEPSEHYKMPEQLRKYVEKRNFESTPEPRGVLSIGNDDSFVIHRHHATRLHYDLRLEQEGTLKSWAVPRGMPAAPGIKRLAVATEDHPMEYLSFEGTIPKGQYGGGDMWRYCMGRYEITKHKKGGFYFKLNSPELNAEYRMHETKDKEWILERVDNPQIDWLNKPVDFMLSQSSKEPPMGKDFIYEVKWDGIRAMIIINDGEIRIMSRNQNDITDKFPELQIPEEAFRASCAIFDGEIVCLDDKGRPQFKKVINRIQQSTEGGIRRAAVSNPAYCYLFDCLYLDGRAIVNEALIRRKEWLKDSLKKGTAYRMSDTVLEGKELFEAARQMNLEGIMAKDRTSRYLPGKRSASWIKVKVRNTVDCIILGYTKGKGDRSRYFGALHIGQLHDEEWIYRGKVGSGFTEKSMKEILKNLNEIERTTKYIKEKPLDDSVTTWLKPEAICEIQYASLTPNNTYREPVFVRLRPDLAV